MAIREKKRPTTMEEAVEQLKSDPLHAVRMHVTDVDVEVHLVGEERRQRLGDFMAEGGGWKGESVEEILRILREARKAGGTTGPPSELSSGWSFGFYLLPPVSVRGAGAGVVVGIHAVDRRSSARRWPCASPACLSNAAAIGAERS